MDGVIGMRSKKDVSTLVNHFIRDFGLICVELASLLKYLCQLEDPLF